MACRDTGSTGLSRRTWHFHLPGKCRVFPRKRFTFPPRPTGVPAPQAPLVALGISTPRESAGLSSENGSLSLAKTVHFPSCHETSKEVQQGMLGKVLSIQALWKRYSAGPGVKWWICGKKRAVQQILRTYMQRYENIPKLGQTLLGIECQSSAYIFTRAKFKCRNLRPVTIILINPAPAWSCSYHFTLR